MSGFNLDPLERLGDIEKVGDLWLVRSVWGQLAHSEEQVVAAQLIQLLTGWTLMHSSNTAFELYRTGPVLLVKGVGVITATRAIAEFSASSYVAEVRR